MRSTKDGSTTRRFEWLRRWIERDSRFQRDHLAHVNGEIEDDTFEDDVVALRNFCFVSVETCGTSFEMHALVQLATRTWLAANGELEHWKEQFVSVLSAASPIGAYENWAVCRPLFAHAKAAAEQRPEGVLPLTQWATLLCHAAWYAERRGNVAEAEQLSVASMKTRQKVLGQDHEDTWSAMAMVVNAYLLGGEWKKAEELRQKVMEKSSAKLGVEHPHTLTSMHNLASTYSNHGRWEEAEELLVEVLETRKTKLGADHLDTLTCMHNLALTWRSLGRAADAIALMRQCVDLRQEVLRAGHPDVLASLTALERWEAGEAKEAERKGAVEAE